MDIAINVTSANIKSLSVKSSTIGNITTDVSQIESLVDQVFAQALPPINALLAKSPIKVPNKVLGLFELSELSLKNHNGYIEAGLTPHFVAPSEPIFDKYEDKHTKPGTYRYVQSIENGEFSMWDTMLNEAVTNPRSVEEIEQAIIESNEFTN